MTSVPSQGVPEYEDITVGRTGGPSWWMVVIDAWLGFGSLTLALHRGAAVGHVTFAHDAWRAVLALVGAGFAWIAVRSAGRILSGYKRPFTQEWARRARRYGTAFVVVGIAILAAVSVPAVARASIDFHSWVNVAYAVSAVVTTIIGLALRWNPSRAIRTERARRGEGLAAVARILRANDTGTRVNDAPQVKIDFEIAVPGRDPYEASDRIVMQQAKLALLIPGATVKVTVDRVDPSVFHIDWDSWTPPR